MKMMQKNIYIILCCTAAFMACNSSKKASVNNKQEVVYAVGGTPTYMDEFSYVFNKNRNIVKDTINSQYINDYLNRSVNYKLKLKESYALKMDTNPAYVQELAGYRKTLAKTHLTDNEVTEHLKEEAYERMKWEVKASHILVMCNINAKPEDSLKAYKKIQDIRKQIVQDGKDFAEMAATQSEDPSAVKNKGDLGYFSALQMIYPFEGQAYNTATGEISKVFRTRFGYHILKVNDKRKTAGDIEIAHIFMNATAQDEIEVQNKMNAIQEKLKSGASFDALVLKHSEDKASKNKGGKIGFVNNYSNFPGNFKDICFSLEKDGDFSAPFKTQYGWHIVKRLSLKPMASYKEMDYTLSNKINRDSRSNLSRESVIARIKKENNFKEYKKVKERVMNAFDNSYLEGNWVNKVENQEEVLISYDLENYSVKDFVDFMVNVQKKVDNVDLNSVLEVGYKTFVDVSTLDYEESNLDKTNVEFQNVYREYRDAILVFNISGDKVWNKASEDTAGLREFFNKNRGDYSWEERVEAVYFNASSKEIMNRAIEMSKAGMHSDSILKVVNKENILNLVIKEGKYENGDDLFVDKVYMRPGYKELKDHYMDLGSIEADQYVVILVKKWIAPMPKELNETRGPAITKYQKQLENEWIKELRVKYPVVVKEDVFNTFKNKILIEEKLDK
jgi:peptidyl-prolyl cis-trans isomerase SurA